MNICSRGDYSVVIFVRICTYGETTPKDKESLLALYTVLTEDSATSPSMITTTILTHIIIGGLDA